MTGEESGPLREQAGNHHIRDEPRVARERPAAALAAQGISVPSWCKGSLPGEHRYGCSPGSARRATHLHHPAIEIVEGDVRVASDVQRAVDGTQVVVSAVHGFAGPGGVSPASIDREGNRRLIDAAVRAHATIILMSVVGAASDHPMELFRMKDAAERHLRASAAHWTIVRSTAFLETWIDLMVQTTDRSGRALVFGRGDNPINFVSVRDVGTLVERVFADPGARMQTLEIGGPEHITMTKLAIAVQPAGPDVAPRHMPRSALRAMSLVFRPFWAERARQAAAALVLDTIDMRFDPAAIRARYPDLPLTSPSDVIARIAREKNQRPH